MTHKGGNLEKKSGLVMEFFLKGGRGGLDPIHNFEAHICASKCIEFLMKIESYGYFWALFLKGCY